MKLHQLETADLQSASAPVRRRRPRSELAYSEQEAGSDYDFLVGSLISQETLERAITLSVDWHVPVHEVLIASGWISQADYTKALAEYSGVQYIQKFRASQLNLPNIPDKIQEGYRAGLFTGNDSNANGQFETVILASTSPQSPSALKRMMARLGNAGERLFLVSTHQLRHSISALRGSLLTREAIFGLENSHPYCSASRGMSLYQKFSLLTLLIASIASVIAFPEITLFAASILLSVLFFPVVWLRFQACILTFKRPFNTAKAGTELARSWRHAASGLSSDATLPVYTLLVPIFKEKDVLFNLIQALLRLDYPAAKLDVKLIFEECDHETLDVAQSFCIPDHFEFIIVPDSQPRTKPKALNYAMQFARGDYVVIYDAEDQPEPDQLKKAVTAFRMAPESVACLQARLSFYNASENWLTRQFSIEYNSLFSGILPTLQSLDFPIPLGGTSNHFRMSALKKTGGWDAFNVTEDADLGMRLYRSGYTCRVLNSVTWEEATCSIKAWIPQRTRWIKGWVQTYVVHMRNPLRLYRQLGSRGFWGFQVTIGGFLMSAFIHPLFLAFLLFAFATNSTGVFWQLFQDPYWVISALNLIMGYSTAMCLGVIVSWQSGRKRLIPFVITMPLYWLLISCAAYRAFYQYFRNPFLWEKTTHGVTKIHAGNQH
ncbi:MAG: glycosyltransferase [Methyloligellaceae bacterium]